MTTETEFPDYQIAIYSTGLQIYADAVAPLAASAPSEGDGRITPPGVVLSACDASTEEQAIRLSHAYRFSQSSPQQRMYLVEGAVSYVCDLEQETLLRFGPYPVRAEQPDLAQLMAEHEAAVLARNVQDCQFDYRPGVAYRTALVTLRLNLAREEVGDVRLIRQVAMDNQP
ncbi:hypothetical protein CAI21_13325 [Alkalilimnicola ehrlichii]|uniref:Uncharacterized protein n=1 Tax=Alkalilimnicola ehrlichii TaxID=351052 RepID=A0A3E0WPL2_9GAMM|nr:hypothetical protein [Alkalilimnicola ehrlichii]RFA28291.1 hypothetical protein CAI21_13325 [Alkalilimnicola ehrlichii]RFA34892.1 hypothetical protein CAL65_14460 [Alkalilimnicola ehrlichii]